MIDVFKENELIIILCIMLAAFYPIFLIFKKISETSINKLAHSEVANYTKIFNKHHLKRKVLQLFIGLYLIFCGDVLESSELITGVVIRIKDLIIPIYIIIVISSFLMIVVNIGSDIYKIKPISRKIPISLHAQIIKMIISLCSILTILSAVLGIKVSSVFTSLGAAAALFTFVFKDIALGLVSSLLLTFQDVIRPDDWVTLPKYNADGNVEKITITVVIIRNFDKTCTMVPTSAFLMSGVKNWRGMTESGGRRIKRALNIDMDTISICDQMQLNEFKKFYCLKEFAKKNEDLFNAENEASNLTIFRHYIEQYLKTNQNIHQEDFTFLVRHLDPTPMGLPVELYIFTKDTNWEHYETIQADIIDHLLGVLSQFKLKIFQPTIPALPHKSGKA